MAVLPRREAAAGRLSPINSSGEQNVPIDLKAEVQGSQPEPLLPIEKKLIGISLGLGIVLLAILIIVNFLGS